ncbi:MAG: tRNA (adenosine(37)-N6)-threonylcarbamoyltransferase complex dimerization subunit type 1 TsaB [Actinomycetota bacterium]|nr:tRNA (adenosine(37)-N6)-threonylcarbamoyltransferase complex dimerization subunit type 1 TsaB [Actinomycetota bacterium]
MIILALDTATPQVSCALGGPDGVIGELRSSEERRHGEYLAPAIERLCRDHQVAMRDLGAVAVDIGPGLFTGLRVGMATAKALASALGLPLVGASSLETLAQPHETHGRLVASVVDVRRGEVAWALYQPGLGKGSDIRLVERRPPAVVSPAGLARELAGVGTDVLVVGDGATRYAEQLAEVSGVQLAGDDWRYPTARALLMLGRRQLAAHQGPDGIGRGDADLAPLYLRAADVRVGWEERSPAVGGRGD